MSRAAAAHEGLPRRALGRTGLETTVLGLGGAPLGNLFAPVTERDVAATFDAAWAAGVRHFDTAPLYGHGLSERRCGAALRARPREAFTLSTKVGRLLEPQEGPVDGGAYKDVPPLRIAYDYSRDGVLRSLEESLKRLGQARVDVLLIHDIDRFTHGDAQPQRYREAMQGAFPALAALRAQGVVRAIGLGVNEWQVCADVLRDAEPDCFLLAGRYTLLEQEALEGLLEPCRRRGVSVLVGGAFNSGILATGAVADARYNYARAPESVRERVAAIDAVARAHGVPLPAAALQFPLAHPAVCSLVLGARSAAEVQSAADWLREPIPPAFWAALKAGGLLHEAAPTPSGPQGAP
jgi:D-threo-aldose 1-dehydrogenase